jgi:hypothetical protein
VKSLPRRGYFEASAQGSQAADHAPELRARASFVSRLTTNLGARVADRYELKIKHRRSSLSPELFYVARQEGKLGGRALGT